MAHDVAWASRGLVTEHTWDSFGDHPDLVGGSAEAREVRAAVARVRAGPSSCFYSSRHSVSLPL